MKKISKNSQNSVSNSSFAFANLQNDAIFYTIGCGSLMYEAAVVTVNGGNLPRIYGDSVCNESAGRTSLCGVTSYTSSTPAGSFFVPDVEVWEKSEKDLIRRRLELCTDQPTAVVRDTLPATPSITVTTPPGVCLQPSFSVPAPELIQ